jgi:hypothetical protein
MVFQAVEPFVMKLCDPGKRADVFSVLKQQCVSFFEIPREALNVACVLFLGFGEPFEPIAILAVVIDVNSGQLVQLNCGRLQTFFNGHYFI